jgi:iron complex outermembrane recepter protein
MQDNVPLRASGFCNVNELFDANSEQAARIEVIKGPASVLYGSNAMHGMINIISPLVEPVHRIGLEFGAHDYVRLKASLGNDAWRLDANGTRDGGYKDESGFGQHKLTLAHHRDAGDWDITARLSVTKLNQETAGFIEGPSAYKLDALRKSNPNPEAYRDTQAAHLNASLARTLANGTRILITPYARYTEMDFIQHFLPGQALEQNRHASLGFESAYYLPDWTLGIDVERTDGYLRETQPGPTVGSAFLAATIPQGDHYDFAVVAVTYAAFAEYRAQPMADLDLSVGVRLESVTYDYDNRMITGRTKADGTPCLFGGCRFNRPADRRDTFTNLSPKLGLTYNWSDESQVYANLSRGFRAPQTGELYRLQDVQNVTSIDSEVLNSLEIGFRGGDARFSFDVSTFLMRKDNFIFRDTNRLNVDNGKTSHRGIEVSLAHDLGDDLRARLNWTYAIHRYENNPLLSTSAIEGNDMDTAPRQFGGGQIEWRASARWHAELEWVHMGRYFEDAENEHPYEGHDLFNLRVKGELNPRLTTFVRITNLFDARYAERADYAQGMDRYFVGEPRALYVGLSADL